MSSGTDVRNVIIVGSGPAGYTAATYAARAELEPLMFEGSVTAGGALINTTEVENYPGFPDGIMGPELMSQMRKQAERFGTELVADDIVGMDLDKSIKTVADSSGAQHSAHTVILAMGSAYRTLGVPGEDQLSGHGVSWCATCDGFFFRNKDIAVIGGGDSAMEEATFLTRFARSVTVVHRRDQLRASAIMADRARNHSGINFVWNRQVAKINGKSSVSSVTLADTETGAEHELDVSGVFIAVGHDPRSELIDGQVDLDDQGYVVTDGKTTRTNLAGVFACGDLVDHIYQQAVTAAGTGCSAALDAERFLASQAAGDQEQVAAAQPPLPETAEPVAVA